MWGTITSRRVVGLDGCRVEVLVSIFRLLDFVGVSFLGS